MIIIVVITHIIENLIKNIGTGYKRGLFRLLLFQSVGETVISLVVATVTKFSSPIFS